ncbi:MAG TPA: cupin domain-containing protein [Ktedonobacterales bacterium]|nr:cupin domain-containing protein [Ktedonobacterales bacterium]
MSYKLITREELRQDGNYYEFEGHQFGGTNISFILVDVPPGGGPRLHSHPYEEVFIVQEGQATFTIGATTLEVKAGNIVIAPPEVPHKFINSGEGRLRQVDIHLSGQMITKWLED